MKKSLLFSTFIFCLFINLAYSQKTNEPRLVGSWSRGEDFREFIYHKIQVFPYFLDDNPNAKIVARLCSSSRMSVALVTSNGFAFDYPTYGQYFNIPSDRFFFARWSKCPEKSEQYWFVPENSNFEYDEIISAEKVQVNRWVGGYYDNPFSQPAENEFAENIKKFIVELKSNNKTEGFIIRNLKMKNSKLKKALEQIQNKKVDKSRFQIIRKRIYQSYYPEFMTVTVKE